MVVGSVATFDSAPASPPTDDACVRLTFHANNARKERLIGWNITYGIPHNIHGRCNGY